MSYETERYYFEKLPGQSLAVIECGWQICHSNHSNGRRVYPDYSASFILKGKGKYSVNGRTYDLHSGQGFIITPGVPNTYIADSKDPWEYIYVIFKGPDSSTLIHNAGLNDDNVIFSFSLDDKMVNTIRSMHAAGKNSSAKGYDVLGYFLLVMSRMISNYTESGRQNLYSEHYIRKALSYIEDHSAYDITVKDVANFVGIDRTHLYRLFMKYIGISPSLFLVDTRLKRAASLMEHPQLSVNEIAISSGFYDLSHFSRMFIAKYGVSPGKYKKLKEKESI